MATAHLLFLLGLGTSSALIVRAPVGLTASDLVFIVTVAVAGVTVLFSGVIPRGRIPRRIGLGIAAVCMGLLLSSGARGEPEYTAPLVARLAFLAGPWLWLFAVLFSRSDRAVLAIRVWTLSMAVSAAVGVAQLFVPDIVPSAQPIWGRSTGLTLHPNDLGASCGLAWVPAVMLALRRGDPPSLRLGAAVVAALITSGIFVSGSVAALVQASVSAAFWIAIGRGIGRRQIALAIVVAALLFGITEILRSFGAVAPTERIRTQVFSSDGGGTFEIRREQLEEAIDEIGESPWIGRGMGLEGMESESGSLVHNTLVSVWLDGGILSFLGLLLTGATIGHLAWSETREAQQSRDGGIAAAVAASCLGVFLHSFAAPILFQRYIWIPVGLLVAVHRRRLLLMARPVPPGAVARRGRLEAPHPGRATGLRSP